MGNWHISIQGVGAHHNLACEADADRMMADFVIALRKAGHTISVATMTHGGITRVDADPEAYSHAKREQQAEHKSKLEDHPEHLEGGKVSHG